MLSAAGRFVGKAVDILSAGGNMAAGIFMMLVSLVVCYEAFMRYIVDKPTTWAMSVSLFVFMWFPFLSSPYGIQIGKHVSCDIFVSKFHKPTREWLGILTDITSLIYIAALGYYGYDYFREAYEFSYKSVGLVQYPLWLLRIIFPISKAC